MVTWRQLFTRAAKWLGATTLRKPLIISRISQNRKTPADYETREYLGETSYSQSSTVTFPAFWEYSSPDDSDYAASH